MIKEIEDLTGKAKRFLRSAEVLLLDGDYDSCVSRQIGDYAIGFKITKEEAESRLEKARNFVTEVEQHLKEVIKK